MPSDFFNELYVMENSVIEFVMAAVLSHELSDTLAGW